MQNSTSWNHFVCGRGKIVSIATTFKEFQMLNPTFKTSDGFFVGIGHEVVNFNTRAVIVGAHTEGDEIAPVLREIGANGKLRGGKWVANPKFLTKQ
jgi:hypothetical protein